MRLVYTGRLKMHTTLGLRPPLYLVADDKKIETFLEGL
jgi:hypothetical protein